MSPRLQHVALAALLAAPLAAACAEPQQGAETRPAAPVSMRGAVVMEPPRLAIGEVALVDVSVVTPPGHRVRPLAAPASLPGLWLLDVETPPTQQEPSRWVHRTRFRVRARAVGSFTWPAQDVQVEPPDGDAVTLTLEARPFEVESVARELPGRSEPFGLRRPAGESAPAGFWGSALIGAFGALASVALVVAARRLRRADAPAVVATGAPTWTAEDEPWAEWREAMAQLDAAEQRMAADPRAAADQLSAALRGFVTHRFGLRAVALTTEELAVAAPPFAMTTRWSLLVQTLARLDAMRFCEPRNGTDAAPELRGALQEARALLARHAPPGEAR